MLNYFKKQRVQRGVVCAVLSEGTYKNASSECGTLDCNSHAKRNSLRSLSSFCDEVFLGEFADDDSKSIGDGLSLGSANIGYTLTSSLNEGIFRCNSRLSMSLLAIVSTPSCLSYFVQYLERTNSLPLIKFYLDTDNFKISALEQLEKEHLSDAKKMSIGAKQKEAIETTTEKYVSKELYHGQMLERAFEQRCKEVVTDIPELYTNGVKKAAVDEGIEHNCVPELKTLCDLSMRKPLTDDEKSRIYTETNKQITKCHKYKQRSDSELSLCSFDPNVTVAEHNPLKRQVSAASVKDAIAIYQKYLIANARHFVYLPLAILSQISLLLCQRDDDATMSVEKQPISAHCFDNAQQYVLLKLERDHLNDFLQSSFYCKYCIELIESSGVVASHSSAAERGEKELNIYDILYSEVTLFFFMEFLEQQGERECLDFWTAAINFRKSYSRATASEDETTEAQTDAMIIYDKFFSLQSDCRLWITERLRSHVEERICAVGQVALCFDLPLQIIANYLDCKYFRDFLKTQLFENYHNELKTKIGEELVSGTMSREIGNVTTTEVGNDVPVASKRKLSLRLGSVHNGAQHRKTSSDCTNDSTHRDFFKHISQKNTLLAMDSSSNCGAHLKRLDSTGISLDSRHITNPSLLWRRVFKPEGDGLKFGRINSLGRYERDFQTVDAFSYAAAGKHNWSLSVGGHKLKNAVRKLAHLPEDKMQEEIAWQVAEMIINDVTSITLSNDNKSGKSRNMVGGGVSGAASSAPD